MCTCTMYIPLCCACSPLFVCCHTAHTIFHCTLTCACMVMGYVWVHTCTCTYSVSQKSPPLNYSHSPSVCPLHSMVESPHLQSPILPPHPLCFQYQCLYECVIHHLQVFIPCIWSAGTPRTGPQAGTAFQPQLPFHTILYFVVTREYRH
jgi:hypothetical protein